MSISTPPTGPLLGAEAIKGAPMAPAEFAASRVGGAAKFLGSLVAPVAVLGLMGIGLKMIVEGQPPKMFRA